MILQRILRELRNQIQVWLSVMRAESKKNAASNPKDKILFIFSRFHADPKNMYHKCGTGLTQAKILKVLEELGYDVYFGGQEDWKYPKNYIKEAKAIIYIAPALPKFINYKPKGKLILWANNSHVLVRNSRMYESAKKWNLPVESLGPEKHFLPAYEVSDYLMFSGNQNCVRTFTDNGVPKEKMVHWNNNIDPSVYRISENKFAEFTFVHWSSEIGLRKGLPAMLAAWKKWNNPKARLILMGMTTNVGEILLYKKNLGGGKSLNLPPGVVVYASKKGYPAQDPFVSEILNRSHVGVFPTLEDGQASVVLEMAGSGLPVITTEESGYELDPSWSYKVEKDNVDSLLAAFNEAYNDPNVLEKGKNARQFVIDNHNPEAFQKNFKEFLVKILGKH